MGQGADESTSESDIDVTIPPTQSSDILVGRDNKYLHSTGLIENDQKPEGLGSDMLFCMDCDVCGEWVHNVCAWL